jgi:hypothetical protein
MASDIPKKDLRRITDWHAELGLARLTAELSNGTLSAWWQHPTTGEYHEIRRAYWQEEGTVKRAAGGWGWPLGLGWPFSSEPFRSAAIYAARRRRRRAGAEAEKLQPGASRKYDHDAITRIAEEAIQECVDDKLAWYLDRVAGKLEHRGINVPGPTVLRDKCAPIYKRARAKK